MKKGDYLFVYGTLRRGGSADLSNKFGAGFICPDKINGNLYNISWFPGVKTEAGKPFDYDSPTVTGDVFEIQSDNLVVQLDAYESYPSLYDRFVVRTEGGRDVWVYHYNHSVTDDRLIRGGDWFGPTLKLMAA